MRSFWFFVAMGSRIASTYDGVLGPEMGPLTLGFSRLFKNVTIYVN
jgi:hypothetical protein